MSHFRRENRVHQSVDYRAVLYLCSLDFGPQAMMLNRSLIEDALTARRTELNRDEAMERIERHERHMIYLFAETLKERELDLGALAQLDPLSEEELEKARKDFGSFGQLGWTGRGNIVSLFQALDEQWATITNEGS